MNINRRVASSRLKDIEGVERRTRQTLAYAASSGILMVWGVLVAAGYLYNHFLPYRSGPVWLALMLAGVGATFWLRIRNRKAVGMRPDNRIVYGMLTLIAFGLLWSIGLGRLSDREMGVFWPTLFMFGYVLMGYWLGGFFSICGVVVTALALAGYAWLGSWFHLWMAAVMAGALIGGGLWLRRL